MQKDWFAKAGYDVMTVINEPIVRLLICKTVFDLMLSNVCLPEVNGIFLLQWSPFPNCQVSGKLFGVFQNISGTQNKECKRRKRKNRVIN